MFNPVVKLGNVLMAALLIAAVLMPAFAQSASAASPVLKDPQILPLRYDIVNARIAFLTGYMEDMMSLIPQASGLHAHVNKLNSDMATLQGYVASNDNTGFNDFVRDTITPDSQAALSDIRADREHFKAWGVTNETRLELRSDYQGLKAKYESQMNDNKAKLYSMILNDRINVGTAVIQKNDNVIANMSSKGCDVSGMLAVQCYGHSVISKLESVQGSDPVAIKDMLKSICLGNGATYSEHYYAEFDLARLQSVSAKLAPVVAASNSTEAKQALDTANAKLGSVSGLLQTIDHQPYTGDQKDQVWGDNGLKGAAQGLKTAIEELKAGKGQE